MFGFVVSTVTHLICSRRKKRFGSRMRTLQNLLDAPLSTTMSNSHKWSSLPFGMAANLASRCKAVLDSWRTWRNPRYTFRGWPQRCILSCVSERSLALSKAIVLFPIITLPSNRLSWPKLTIKLIQRADLPSVLISTYQHMTVQNPAPPAWSA